jgi:hypothetical protein
MSCGLDPCSNIMLVSPIPPNSTGAYTTGVGMCLLYPNLGRIVPVMICCALWSFGESIFVADRLYFAPGKKIDRYPWIVSSVES